MQKKWTSIIWCMLFFVVVSFLFSCKNDKGDQKEADPQESKINDVEIPEDFLAFYKAFHEDAEFQRSHIIFPLQGKSQDSKWMEDDWVVHKPFNIGEDYKHDFENMNGVIVESLVENLGRYYIIRRFSKVGGEWHLIYYAQDSNMEGFVPEEEFKGSKNIDIDQIK